MSNTTFASGTIIEASWLNDVNDTVYDVLGDGTNTPTTPAEIRTNLDVPSNTGDGASGTWNISINGSAASFAGVQAVANGGTGQTSEISAFNALKQAGTETSSGVFEKATTAEAAERTAGTVITADRFSDANIILGTPVASTSGTSIDFTSIPSWVKRITVNFAGVSVSSTGIILIQLGDSGGFETSGYLGVGSNSGAGAAVNLNNINYTTGFGLTGSGGAANILHGSVTLSLVNPSTNTWAAQGNLALSNLAVLAFVVGTKALSATLDRVRITTNGADTFDAGVINIMYE